MTQRKIDDLFFTQTPSSSTRSSKRSRIPPTTTNDRDEFDDIFEINSSAKRRRTNNTTTKQTTDIFDFDEPSISTNTIKKVDNDKSTGSLKKKRSATDTRENTTIDELFSNDTRKKLRRPMKTEESNIDLLDMFKTRTNTNIPSTISTIDDFKTPNHTKTATTQKKIKMFFDDIDLISSRDQNNEQDDIKEYVHIKPVLVTGGQWLSKEAETKSTCETIDSSDNSTGTVSDDQRNLMHIQYVSLIVDEQIVNSKKSKGSKSTPVTCKLSNNSIKKLLGGKSFQKQLILCDSTTVRKENLQSCYNALLEDINKPRLPPSNKHKKSTKSKSSKTDDIEISDDDEQINDVDFFDLPTRKKKF